jgi:hypothetical protein
MTGSLFYLHLFDLSVELPYSWKQTLSDVTITIPVPHGTRGKDISVTIGTNHLKVALKNNLSNPIVDGLLHRAIKEEESGWNLSDGSEITMNLEKVNRMEWWKCVIQGHPEIDTTKIQPENSKLSDLDNETRAMVEKMMFDQRQRSMGLPSSDDLQKQQIFEKLKKQHPEMNVSYIF